MFNIEISTQYRFFSVNQNTGFEGFTKDMSGSIDRDIKLLSYGGG